MRNLLLVVVTAVIVIGFGARMTTYTVDFTEAAVVATFGQVDETSGVVSEPGLRLKWPAPIQTVTIYDKRVRMLESGGVQVQLRDNRQLVLDTFLTWRVSDPRVFYSRFNRSGLGGGAEAQYDDAADAVRDRLQAALNAEAGRFTMESLFAPASEGGSAMAALEASILENVRRGLSEGQELGVEVELVGISSAVLPQEVTTAVFERMKQSRGGIARRARSEGQSEASRIRDSAQQDAERILAFVGARASEIRASGDVAATEFLSRQNVEPELAEFLARVEFLQEGWGRALTVIVPWDVMGADMFNPAYLDRVSKRVPSGDGGEGEASP